MLSAILSRTLSRDSGECEASMFSIRGGLMITVFLPKDSLKKNIMSNPPICRGTTLSRYAKKQLMRWMRNLRLAGEGLESLLILRKAILRLMTGAEKHRKDRLSIW